MTESSNLDRDRERLVTFLRQTHSLLRELYLEDVRDAVGRPLAPRDLKPLLERAWTEFAQSFNPPGTKNVAEQRIRDLSRDQMTAFGLYGAQLELKLEIIDRLRDIWEKLRTIKSLKALLDAIDVLLDSLIKAARIDEALKELKDIFCTLLDLLEDPKE
ncbi:MAG: hypothetical protein KDI03_08070 [Anaerolineae bacterium]|nr:hypothetical protein [Anaerolineae bacterium]MCB0206140.1 hypothetical protein [Anaerolineae bacterium]